MLESIHIENVALIKKLDLAFSDGFSAFTGETGAGKSIIIDSIGVLCGNRITKELIRAGEEYALVEGMFSSLSDESVSRCAELGVEPDEDGYLYISRKIAADGKSVCRVNSKQVPSSLLRELSAFLINIHGQHDNQDLLKREKHLSILDKYADCQDEYKNYTEKYSCYTKLKKEYENISQDDAEKQRTIEMLQYQIEEISSLKLKPDEEDELTSEKKRLSNIEKISENAMTAYGALFGDNLSAVESIDRALGCISNLAKMTDEADELLDRLERSRSEVYDIAETLKDIAGESEENPTTRLDRIEKRLYDIYKLKRKYGPDIPSILEYLEKAQKKLSDIELSDVFASELEVKIKDAAIELKMAAETLTQKRKSAAARLKTEIEHELDFLEMAKVKFSAEILAKEFCSDGADDMEFLIQTNAGLPFSPLSKTASGGELSRIMLAIKSVIAKKDGVDTVIFDEVDTGISGKTSRRIGIKLLETAKSSQVMCVTHSAQIASLADSHFLVSKAELDGTTLTSVSLLDDQKRIDETARIISGINITESARKTAVELINEFKK